MEARKSDSKMKIQEMDDLNIEALRKKVGDFVISAHLSIKRGERAVLRGKSGSGKTSFLRILAGLDPLIASQDQGRIFLGTREITHFTPQKRNIGFISQDQALFPSLNVLDNVTFGLRMRGIPAKVRETEAIRWLEKVDLKSKVRSSVESLSGGEKQRVAFLRAIIWKPQLLLLDEPFSALDTDLRKVLRTELVELHQLWPVPLLLVTHDEMDIQNLATARLQIQLSEFSNIRTVCRDS
jgi:ABC-type Fe3+/spermidine/putrescine transport system ATPase subunit